MTSTAYRVRRATLEDIGQLMALWESMSYPREDLARRITEFQVAENEAGEITGAVGLQILEKQGRIHSECFRDFAQADQLRGLLWERVHSVATNHGLVRLWTSEEAPFWAHCGMSQPDPHALEKLPAVWKPEGRRWFTLKLREDVEAVLTADKEFALFMEAERNRTQRAIQHAKALKILATAIAFTVLVLVLGGAFYLLQRQRMMGH